MWILMLTATLLAAGCGSPVDRVLKEDAARAQVMDRFAADSALARAMLERLLREPALRDVVMQELAGNADLTAGLIDRTVTDRALVDQFMTKAMHDENTNAYLMGMVRGMSMAPPAGGAPRGMSMAPPAGGAAH